MQRKFVDHIEGRDFNFLDEITNIQMYGAWWSDGKAKDVLAFSPNGLHMMTNALTHSGGLAITEIKIRRHR